VKESWCHVRPSPARATHDVCLASGIGGIILHRGARRFLFGLNPPFHRRKEVMLCLFSLAASLSIREVETEHEDSGAKVGMGYGMGKARRETPPRPSR